MKRVVVTKSPAGGQFAVGAVVSCKDTSEVMALETQGYEVISESEHNAIQARASMESKIKADAKASAENSIKAEVAKAKQSGAIAPADTAVEAEALRRVQALDYNPEAVELVKATIGGRKPQGADVYTQRMTLANPDQHSRVEVTAVGLEDASQGVIKCTAPQNDLIRAGNFKEASKLAREAATIMKQHHMRIAAGGDFLLRDMVKAATYSDPNSQVGSMAGDLVLMRNLGYLKNKLAWMPKLTTDLSSEPAKFGQAIFTRYITPPSILTWVPGVGFTNAADSGFGAQQVSDSGTGTTQSAGVTLRTGGAGAYALDAVNAWGIPNKSQPSTTDRSVTLNMFKSTEIEFPVSTLAGTVRNLFAEQLSAQTYTLAETINQHVLNLLLMTTPTGGSAWGTGGVSGLTYSYTKSLANWNLSGMIGVKNKMTIAKIPDVGRFLLLHSFYYDKLLEDSNLLNAKAIMALVHKDEAEFNTGELPALFGVKPLESQLASSTGAALTTWVDDTTLDTTAVVGFAGNMSAALFVSRPPQNYTEAAQKLGVPITASIRLVTEPDSGLTVMVFSYADNGNMSLSQRVCLMYGAAQGDPRCGILIKPA